MLRVWCLAPGKALLRRHRNCRATQVDGPCAVAALRRLGWYAEGDENGLRIQTAAFGRLGREVNNADTLLTLGGAMILFFYPGSDAPFHVMYTDGAGNLCGENSDRLS